MSGVAVNARFSARPVSGVERYAHELVRRLGDRVRLVKATHAARGLAGHLWEQILLPLSVDRRELLWSPANTGPLRVAHQVVTMHDVSVLEHPEWFDRGFAAWYGFLLPRLAKRVLRVITVSEFSRHRILEVLGLPEQKVVAIPNGVDPAFRPSSPEQVSRITRKLGLRSPYLLFVGSFDPRKNLVGLFRAWDRVSAQVQPLELAIVGSEGPAFRHTGVDTLPVGARLLGAVGDEDLRDLYGGALALVIPSVYEGFGLPVLEAMACGVPVVASNTSALPEVAGDAALLVDPLDVDALSAALARVVEDETLRASMRARGFDRVRQFSWDRTEAATWNVLQTALAEL